MLRWRVAAIRGDDEPDGGATCASHPSEGGAQFRPNDNRHALTFCASKGWRPFGWPAITCDEQAIAAIRPCVPSGRELTSLLIFPKVGRGLLAHAKTGLKGRQANGGS